MNNAKAAVNDAKAPLNTDAGESSASLTGDRSEAPAWAWVVATFFGVGRLHPGPGTWGSAATVVLWFTVTRFIAPPGQTICAVALVALATVLGIPAATRVARASGSKDPQFVVIDEVVGQLITYIAVPTSWKTLLVGFILFRAFDILKPFPLRRLERLPEGAGIVIDDIGAGVYARAVMQLLLQFRLLG